MRSRSQMVTEKEQGTSLGKSGEGWSGEGHSPQEIQDRDQVGESTSTGREKPGRRPDSLKESPLFRKPKEMNGGFGTSGQLLPAHSLCLPESVLWPITFALINLATKAKLLLRECP